MTYALERVGLGEPSLTCACVLCVCASTEPCTPPINTLRKFSNTEISFVSVWPGKSDSSLATPSTNLSTKATFHFVPRFSKHFIFNAINNIKFGRIYSQNENSLTANESIAHNLREPLLLTHHLTVLPSHTCPPTSTGHLPTGHSFFIIISN